MGTWRCSWIVAALAVGVVMVSGCTKTQLKSTWKDPDHTGSKFSSYLVVAFDQQSGDRMLLENEFVRRLKAKRVTAVPSYRLLPPTGTVDKEAVLGCIEGRDTEAILIIRVAGSKKTTDAYSRVPGAMSGPGTRDFVDAKHGWYQPGYDYAVYEVEATIWDIATEKIVWEAKTDFLNPKSAEFLKNISEYSKMIVEAMEKDAMI